MKWVLIMWITGTNLSSMGSVEFETKEACMAAATEVARVSSSAQWHRVHTVCAAKGAR